MTANNQTEKWYLATTYPWLEAKQIPMGSTEQFESQPERGIHFHSSHVFIGPDSVLCKTTIHLNLSNGELVSGSPRLHLLPLIIYFCAQQQMASSCSASNLSQRWFLTMNSYSYVLWMRKMNE